MYILITCPVANKEIPLNPRIKMKGLPMMFVLSKFQTPLFAKLILFQDRPNREGHHVVKKR
jgi:hypothetical protein